MFQSDVRKQYEPVIQPYLAYRGLMAEGLFIRVLWSLMRACSNRAPISLLKRLARRAGIAKRVHARGLRHTHSAELVAGGVLLNHPETARARQPRDHLLVP